MSAANTPEKTHKAEDAEERGEGICRTCLAPIWFEVGEIGGRERTDPDWSDRIKRGGDSLVCFKAVQYRHVPLTGREAAIYDRAYERGADESTGRAEAERDSAKIANTAVWAAAERASRKGYDLDPAEVLEMISSPGSPT